MTEEKEQKDIEVKKTEETKTPTATNIPKTDTPKADAKDAKPAASSVNRPPREFKKNRRAPRRREQNRREFEQKILDIRRVTRVSAGGRRFSFSVSMIIGDKKGKIGVGIGKGGDTALAIEKAAKNAKQNMVKIKTTADMSIPHEVKAKFSSAQVLIIPSPGRGIIAGSALRDVVELSGLQDINGKILSGSKNKLNIAKAVIKALQTLSTPREVVKKGDTKKDKK